MQWSDREAPSVLVVRLSAIGDCIHAVPVIEEIRRQVPGARIGWLTQRGGHSLLQGHPAVDKFHIFERSHRGLESFRSLLRLRRELRTERYDLAIDLQGLTKSGFLARLSGAKRVVGFSQPESRELNRWFVSHQTKVPAEIEHVVDRNLALLPALGLDVPLEGSWNLPRVNLQGTAIGAILAPGVEGADGSGGDPRDEPLAVVNPGTTWPTKVWAQERFAEVARFLVGRGARVLVTWAGAAEEAMADAIVEQGVAGMDDHQAQRLAKAPATSLRELCGLMQRSAVVVANDSGPLHLAVAAGAPAVGVYGPTDPARNGPYGHQREDSKVLAVTLADQQERRIGSQLVGAGRLLDCQYCWKSSCRRGDTACLVELEAQAVIDAVEAVMA